MRSYGQYCPIARAAEILTTRWTPIILRNVLLGANTFGGIAEQAPGIPRTLLTTRLRELERLGVIERIREPGRHKWLYGLTEAGRDLEGVMFALGLWGERWLDLAPEHTDPGVVLESWCRHYLACERMVRRRVVARFDFSDHPKKSNQLWMIFEHGRAEVCRSHPGFDEDIIVHADAKVLAEWHLGRVEWPDAVSAGRLRVEGAPALARALPTWNRRSAWSRVNVLRRV